MVDKEYTSRKYSTVLVPTTTTTPVVSYKYPQLLTAVNDSLEELDCQ